MKNRILSVLLTLSMLLGLFPGTAFAISDTSFSDVDSLDWFSDAVEYVYEKGLMNGTGEDTFSPNTVTTRGMIVTILHNMEGTPAATENPFIDVAEDQYYANAVAWASENGLVSGYGNGIFGPNDPITRQQLAVILYHYITMKGHHPTAQGDLTTFTDADQVSSYALDAMEWAVGAELINGIKTDTLAPGDSATRAQTAVILMHLCQLMDDQQANGTSTGTSSGSSSSNSGSSSGSSGGGSSSDSSGGDSSGDSSSSGSQDVYTSAIAKLVVADGKVTATVNTDKDCTIYVEFLNEETKEVLLQVSAPVTAGDRTVELPIDQKRLPEHFIISAQLKDADGNALNNTFNCITYTSAFEKFENQTINDFDGQVVLNFDETPNNNFAVLNRDVAQIVSSAGVNVLERVEDGTYTLTGIDSQFSTLQPGDKIYLQDSAGNHYVLKIASIMVENGTAVIVEDSDVTLSDFYQVIKIDMLVPVQQPEAAHVSTYALSENDVMLASQAHDDSEDNSDRIFGNVNFGTELKNNVPLGDNASLDAKGAAMIKLEMYYDILLFGPDYFTCTLGTILDLELKLTIGQACTIEPDVPIEVFDFDIPLPATANLVNIPVKITVPYEVDCEAGVTLTVQADVEAGFVYSSDSGYQGIEAKDITPIDLSVGGELQAEIGLDISAGLGAFGDFIEASVGAGAGMGFEGQAAAPITVPTFGSNSYHACRLCVQGESYAYFNVPLRLSYEISKTLKGKIFDFELVRLTWTYQKFYGSVLNDRSSVFGGAPHFDWGDCPNNKYRTVFYTFDNGEMVTGPMVTVKNTGGETVDSGESTYTTYLYPGSYTAETTVGTNEADEAFDVKNEAVSVRLYAKDGTLTGTVTDSESGEVLSGVSVIITQNGDTVATTTTKEDGSYTRKVPAGTYTVSFSAANYSTAVREVTLKEEATLNVALERIENPGTLTGKVTDNKSGEPISNATVTVYDGNDEVVGSGTTDADGIYAISLEEGTYYIIVSAEDYQSKTVTNLTMEYEKTINQNIALDPRISILRGTVTEKETEDGGGNAISGASVTALVDGKEVASTTTDANGGYTLILDIGEYTIKISAEKYASVSQSGVSVSIQGAVLDAQLAPMVAEGTCGDNLYWQLSSDGVLTIFGTGTMWDFNVTDKSVPWLDYMDDIVKIVLEEGVTSIGKMAFGQKLYKWDGCVNLTEVELPEGLTLIDTNAFRNCGKLISVEFPDSLVTIGWNAFFLCSGLTSVTFSHAGNLKTIGMGAFNSCSSLTSLVIPDSVTTIEKEAFYLCDNLTTVVLPKNLTAISNSLFQQCTNLRNLKIPDTVTTIGESAFDMCKNLGTLIIPGGVTEIGTYAFYSTPLESLVLSEGITTLGSRSVYSSYLNSLTLPSSLTKVEESAFESTRVQNINYAGTKEQWEALGIQFSNTNYTITYNYVYPTE